MKKRLLSREFTELELRRMMVLATSFHADDIEGRWAIKTRFRRVDWIVIVEPIPEKEELEVITAFEDD